MYSDRSSNPNGPRRFNYELVRKDIQTQGEITMNVGVNNRIAKWRQDDITNPDVSKDRLMTAKLGEGLDPYSLLNIKRGDLIFTYNRKIKNSGFDTLKESTVHGFAVFNGVRVDPSIKSQEEFESQYKFLGYADSNYDYSNPNQIEHGMAVLVRGSASTWNSGLAEYFPGDKYVWTLPPHTLREREEQRKLLPYNMEHPRDRDQAILERLDYRRVLHYADGPLSRTLEPGYSQVHLHITNLRTNVNVRFTPEQHLALVMRQWAQWCAYVGIMAAVKYGYVIPAHSMPSNATTATLGNILDQKPVAFEEVYEKTRDIEKLKCFEITDNITYRSITGSNYNSGDGPKKTSYQDYNKQFARFLAGKMGINTYMPTVSTPSMNPAWNFIDSIVGLSYQGILDNSDAQSMYSITRNLQIAHNTTQGSGGISLYTTEVPITADQLATSLTFTQRNAAIEFLLASSYYREKVENKVAGIALSHTLRGEKLDYLL